MIFPYQEIDREIIRPIIPIIIKSPSMFIIYYALIDSGADHCIFSVGIANKLNIKLSSKNRVNFRGLGKEELKGFWGKIEIRIGETTRETKVIFADIADFGHGILGQKGFFDHFDVRLNYRDRIIEIKKLPEIN